MLSTELLYRRPRSFEGFPVIAAESTRHGGVSRAPFHSLNLGLYAPGDDPEAVRENRRRFFAGLGLSEEEVAGAHQVHGDSVLEVAAPGQYPGVDALITGQRGIFLTVTVADCTPILLYDARRKVVGAVHAGWRGTVARILPKTLEAMREAYGVDPADCHAYIGTCIDECDYEVDADVADHFGPSFRRWDEARGKFFIDLKGANRALLLQAGLPESQIEVSPYSTVRDLNDYFSYRAEQGRTGRMLALIGLPK